MDATVVCISRTLAAGGTEVGRQVAARLGYDLLDDEIIALAAEKAHVDPQQFAAVEQRETLIARVMDALTSLVAKPTPSVLGLSKGPAPERVTATSSPPPVREEGRRLIREVITEVAKRGRVVIVAHAASIPLAGMDGLLRVLITAPEDVRARRLELGVRVVNEREALKTIQESDRARLSYLRDFYGVDVETPTLYDLVLNTAVLSYEAAAAIVVGAARPGL